MSTRYSDDGINTISDVEIYKANMNIKNDKKQIYHIRMDYNGIVCAFDTLKFFRNEVISTINNPFVMIITGEDFTFPNQVDPRWQEYVQLDLIKNTYNDIINHPLLIHCYIENRDSPHNKTSSIPLGINPREMPDHNIDYITKYMDHYSPIKSRDLKVVSIHRLRAGDREIINDLNIRCWSKYVINTGNYSKDSWWNLLQTYPFVICAHGGGLDPCPKVWEALCVGCIPIIKHSALDDVYSNFPVVFVNNWEPNTISQENLLEWREKYSEYYDNPDIRRSWINKLYLNFWGDKIKSHFK
jgi:hypothetical protein